MTTWTVPATVDSAMPQIKTTAVYSDIRTQATPLALSKEAVKKGEGAETINKQMKALFFGNVGGCIGETSALALLIGGIYLLIRRTINIHIPLAVLLSAFVFALLAYIIEGYVDFWYRRGDNHNAYQNCRRIPGRRDVLDTFNERCNTAD